MYAPGMIVGFEGGSTPNPSSQLLARDYRDLQFRPYTQGLIKISLCKWTY